MDPFPPEEGKYNATWKRECKVPWREPGLASSGAGHECDAGVTFGKASGRFDFASQLCYPEP